MPIQIQQTADVQIWDNRDGTWSVTPYTEKANRLFKTEFNLYAFKVEDSDALRVFLLCLSHGLVISPTLDAYLPSLMDNEGNKIQDPKGIYPSTSKTDKDNG